MKVKELIAALQALEDQEQDVVVLNEDDSEWAVVQSIEPVKDGFNDDCYVFQNKAAIGISQYEYCEHNPAEPDPEKIIPHPLGGLRTVCTHCGVQMVFNVNTKEWV
jgi:hypothetical protein